jgi:hypothetical protein
MHILTDVFYLITSNGQTDYLLVSDVFLAESWILLAKKKHVVRTVSKSNRKTTERGKIDTYNTYMYIHYRSRRVMKVLLNYLAFQSFDLERT